MGSQKRTALPDLSEDPTPIGSVRGVRKQVGSGRPPHPRMARATDGRRVRYAASRPSTGRVTRKSAQLRGPASEWRRRLARSWRAEHSGQYAIEAAGLRPESKQARHCTFDGRQIRPPDVRR